MRSLRAMLLPLALLATVALACSTAAPTPEAPGRDDLRPVSLPDLSGAELSVANQIRNLHADVGAKLRGEASDAEVGAAYGALGTVLLAAEYLDAAEPALVDAGALDTSETLWPYYLGVLYQSRSELVSAEEAFDRARTLGPDVPFEAMRQELEMVLDDGPSNERRGLRALEREEWTTAAYFFRRGLEVTTGNTPFRRSLQHKLGTALYLGGDEAGAATAFEGVIASAPGSDLDEPSALAHYDLGAIDLGRDRPQSAVAHFEGALTHAPDFQDARLALAEALMRAGRAADAVPHFERALEADPDLTPATLGYCLSLIGAGRYRQARTRLEREMAAHPDVPDFAHILARLLVSAPDASVRDGLRAMQIMQALLQLPRTTELGETLAMIRAELGDFEGAINVQGEVLEVVRQSDDAALTQQMERSLSLYQKGQPFRARPGDTLFAATAGPDVSPNTAP